MECRSCPDELVLWAYVRGELPPEEQAVIEEHCQSCSFCADTLAEIGKIDPVSNPAGARAHYESFLGQVAVDAANRPSLS